MATKESSAQKETGNSTIAVIETGGKQYTVSEGDTIQIENGAHVQEGQSITFDSVLLVDDGAETKIGTPYVEGAKVTGTVEAEDRERKISVIRFRSKSRYFKQRGHRQPYAKVKIEKVG